MGVCTTIISVSACVLLLLLPTKTSGQTVSTQTCSKGNNAVIQDGATAYIVGIIAMSQKGKNGYGCGSPDYGSMHAYEAMRFALELLNKKNERLGTKMLTDSYVPGIKLGLKVKDYCADDKSALAAIGEYFPQLSGNADTCTKEADKLTLGVIGASTSDVSMALSEELAPHHIPVISYEATAPQLTNSGKYPNFMRTSSQDLPLMEVIVKIMKEMKWDFVTIVYDSGKYGRTAYTELHHKLMENGICLTSGIMVEDDDLSTADDTMKKVLGAGANGTVFFGSKTYARALIASGNSRLPESGRLQWIFADVSLDLPFPAGSVYQRGVLAVTSASRFIIEFEDHWMRIDEKSTTSRQSIENPWYRHWFEMKNECTFSGNSITRDCATIYGAKSKDQIENEKRRAFHQDQYAEAAVMAVYTYANALRNAQIAKCGSTPGACQALLDMTREEFLNTYLKKVDIQFDTTERIPTLGTYDVAPYYSPKRLSFMANGDLKDASYFIYNYNDIDLSGSGNTFEFRRVGSYINNRLDLNNYGFYSEDRQARLDFLPPSPCPSHGCSPCLGLPADLKYYFEPGDLVINGIFSLHKMGFTPISCGAMMSPNHFQYLEALIYAVKTVNDDRTVLPNIKLGGLGLDDCSSAVLSQGFVAQIQRGGMLIKAKSGEELDPRRVEAYTAAYNSPLTLPLAEAMNMLLRPMVGYRAGSSELDDDRKYPYYLRSVPGIHEEIKAMILLLKKWGWEYVQVITGPTYYSENAEKVFRELAAKAGICIVAAHSIGKTDKDVQAALDGLYSKRDVSTVISLLDTEDNHRFLSGLKTAVASSTDMNLFRRYMALVATTRWGKNEMVVKGLEAEAEGVISLSLRHSSLDKFRTYLSGLRVHKHEANPWFHEWFEAVHSCQLSVTTQGTKACDPNQAITAGGSKFELLYEVESVINAVKAIAKGLDATLKNYCGNGYTTVCNEFVNADDKGTFFIGEIKKVSFIREDLLAPNTFAFNGKSGQVAFEVYSYTRAQGYTKVRDVNPWTQSIVGSTPVKLYNGQPPSQAKNTWPVPSLECIYMFNHMKHMYIPGDIVIGGIFDVHYAGSGPFLCGDVRRSNGALYTELLKFTLARINSGTTTVKLDNFKLGGLALDGCTNPGRATAMINRVLTGMDIRAKTGEKFIPNTLASWMTYDSQTTIDSSKLIQGLNMPVVSPGATALALNDKTKFKTFFRTIPSDSVIVKGMANFVKEMGWKFVVVLNAPDQPNRDSRDLFRKYLEDFGICILASFEFETDGSNEVILRGIDKAHSEVVAVFAEPDQYIEEFLTERDRSLQANTINSKITFVSNRRWGRIADPYLSTAKSGDWLDSSVFFELPSPTISDFTTYLNKRKALDSDDNPWFREVYEEVMKCNLPGSFAKGRSDCDVNNPITSGRNWEQDIWTLSTINAIYTIANAVNNVKIQLCGSNTPLCPQFFSNDNVHNLIMSELDKEEITNIAQLMFKFIDREGNGQYDLIRYRKNNIPGKAGSLSKDGTLTFTNAAVLKGRYKNVKSECPGDCLICRDSSDFAPKFSHISGDIYIVGLFDVHKPGFTPYTCGEINNKHGLPLLEAYNFAVGYINDKKGPFRDKLSGVQLGAIALDMCKQPTRAANLVANIHSGDITLRNGAETINPRRIDAYVATMDTESSIRVADILTQLNVPQISYGATGNELLNRKRYSYFLRTVPADDKQARGIVSYLKKFNYNNIQVIYTYDEIGDPGFEEFKKVAFVNKICINRLHVVGTGENVAPKDADNLMREVLQTGYPSDEVVVIWMKKPLPVLEAASRNDEVAKRFLFIVTDKMGADPDFLKMPSLQNLLQYKNLVTFDIETADVPLFDEYLEHKTPDNYAQNPWFKEYFEYAQGCKWKSTDGGKQCDELRTLPRAEDYIQDPYVIHVMDAVFSAALGIHYALQELCQPYGQPYYGVCDMYRTSGERRQRVMDGLKKTKMSGGVVGLHFFEDGQSDRGFHIYNITTPDNKLKYENVGSFNDSHFLKLDITYDTEFKAQCDADKKTIDITSDDCSCPFKPVIPSRYMKDDSEKRGLTLVYVGDIHQRHPWRDFDCGQINMGVDLQRLLAFFYAINRLNANKDFDLPDSFKLDGVALDTCTHGTRIGQDVYNLLSGNQLCDTDGGGLIISPSTIIGFVVDKDKNAIPISTMLAPQKITTISPTATSQELSNSWAHPYFLRTHNSDNQLADAIFGIAQKANWDSMSIIYTDNVKHRSAANTLMERSEASSMCIPAAVALKEDATMQEIDKAIEQIASQVGARGVVVFLEPEHLTKLFHVMHDRGMGSLLTLVIPKDYPMPTDADVEEADGAFIIQTRSAILKDFSSFLTSLNYTNRGGIPDDWFYEIYQTLHKCHLVDINMKYRMQYPTICDKTERITEDMMKQDLSALHVVLSVFSAVLGLDNIPQCQGTKLDIAACLQIEGEKRGSKSRNELIFDGMLDVNYKVPDLTGDDSFTFSFDENGNGEMGYLIYNHRLVTEDEKAGSSIGQTYDSFRIGEYSTIDGLTIDMKKYFRGRSIDSDKILSSRCEFVQCTCRLPGGREWIYRPDRRSARMLKMGDICEDEESGDEVTITNIPETTDRFEKVWAIIMTIVAAIGAFVSLCLFFYLLVMYPIRGGTSILGFILSFGIVLLYLMVFPFIAHANKQMCGLRRFGLGFVYSIVYSALLVKLVDCWRVRGKGEKYSVKYSKLGRPAGLFMVVVFLVLVQVMINAEWLILEEPEMERICYDGDYWPRCSPHDFYDEGLVLSLSYIFFLIILCLIMSLCSFTSTTNHRESRWILGIIVVSIPCFVIWCTVATLGVYAVRDPAVAVGLLVTATVMMLLVPVRKLYLLHKYNVLIEEEEEEPQSPYAASQKSNDYNSVYGRQYSDTPRLHDTGSNLD